MERDFDDNINLLLNTDSDGYVREFRKKYLADTLEQREAIWTQIRKRERFFDINRRNELIYEFNFLNRLINIFKFILQNKFKLTSDDIQNLGLGAKFKQFFDNDDEYYEFDKDNRSSVDKDISTLPTNLANIEKRKIASVLPYIQSNNTDKDDRRTDDEPKIQQSVERLKDEVPVKNVIEMKSSDEWRAVLVLDKHCESDKSKESSQEKKSEIEDIKLFIPGLVQDLSGDEPNIVIID